MNILTDRYPTIPQSDSFRGIQDPWQENARPAVAYLGGPMRGIPYWNFPAFDEAQAALESLGWTIHSPARHDRDDLGLVPVAYGTVTFPVSACLDWDFARIAESSCIIVLPGWEKSTGCHWEFTVAHALGKPVFQYPELTPVELPVVVTDPVRARIVTDARWQPFESVGPWDDLLQPSYAHMRGVDGPGAWSRTTEDLIEAAKPNNFVSSAEVRVVDPKTGGAKGSKPCQMGALDPVGLEQMGLVAGMGSIKYDRFNFLKGYKWSLSVDALYRHLLSFLAGEDNDPESGLPHMAHAAWHAHALTGFLKRGIGTDDRPPR